MSTKSLAHFEIKSADRGEVTAVFATLNVIDKDGDVTLPGAFEDGAEAPISAYGHKSWEGALPVGKARIRTMGSEAILEGQFFMDTTAGRDTFATVKQLGPLGQWSYGYDAPGAYVDNFGGRKARFLPKLLVHEVSPTLVGVGVNTRTLGTKAGATGQTGRTDVTGYKAAIRPHETDVTATAWDGPGVVAAIPDDASVSDLRSVFAWIDPTGEPDVKGSYRFPHHNGPGGPANVKACIAGIAVLNGARGGTSIPEADRQGVYEHLAAHLRDADREPPELRKGVGGGMKFNEEAMVVMADLSAFLERASEVLALRATKGKGLTPASVELIDWIGDDLRRLQSLLTTSEDEAAQEFLRFVALQHRL